MVLPEEVMSMKQFFSVHHIVLSDIWLESCIEWITEQNDNQPCDREELNTKVYEQWLLLDLREVELPILPPNLDQQVKYTLTGSYSLQMLYIVDISQPKYKQIQKLRNSNALINLRQEFESFATDRLLQLTLTDGVQEIRAIEYKPITCLHVNLTPGIKLLITGPVTVRRGQVILEEKNIKILGGEVEEIMIANAAENILAKNLGLPANPNPIVIEETFENANRDVLRQQQNNNLNIQNKRVEQVNPITNYSSTTNTNPGCITTTQSTVQHSLNRAEEEEVRIATELLFQNDKSIDNHSKQRKTVSKSPDMFEDMDFNDDDFSFNQIENKPRNDKDISKISTRNVLSDKQSDRQDLDNDIFEDMDIDAHLDLIDAQVQQNENKIQVIKISTLNSRGKITNEKIVVHAKYKFVLEKLTVANEEWSLKLFIGDDSGDLVVWMHSDVISELVGYTPSDMMAHRSGIANADEPTTTKMMKAIEIFKSKLLGLNCLMELQYGENEGFPVIVKLNLSN